MGVVDFPISLPGGAKPRATTNRRVLLICTGIAALVALLLLGVVPVGGDAAAHLYRTLLVRHGVLVWDNLWFAGQYPLVSYSLFYYLFAAVLGNSLLGAVGVVLSAVLFASIVLREWGSIARWPSYAFAVLAGGQFYTGDYPYTLAFTTLLATIWALQRRHTSLAVVCAALTLGCNPLAFLFLCLTLLALFPLSSHPRSRSIVIAVTIVVLVGVEFGALWLFPSRGLYYPFGLWRFVLGVPVGVLGSMLTLRSKGGRPLASLFVVWTIAVIAAFIIPSPFGHNLLRPAAIVFPLMLLAALLAGFKPYWLAIPAVLAAFAANVVPYLTMVSGRADPAAKTSFWAPMLGYVARHPAPNFRLEVVPEFNHWEAYVVPKAGYPMARGWYQQLDSGDNPPLYRSRLTPTAYRAWLRSVGVRYVIAANAAPASGAAPEANLLASGRSGLRKVFEAPSGDVYELPDATPVLTGPAPATLTSQTHRGITGWVSRPGSYLLRVHYTPYWRLMRGSLCLRHGLNGMTQVEVRRPGYFSLRALEKPSALLEIILGSDRTGTACPSNKR
ncbi:MAG: hypothetical protein ABSC51_10740 [Gaiellaceae bacterium]|jgi:hypothetical protein